MARIPSYMHIFDKISRLPCTEEQLKNLKALYETQIGSSRKFERVGCLRELLKVLEKRDELSPENLTVFEQIASGLNAPSILRYFIDQNDSVVTHSSPSHQVLPTLPTNPKMRVYDLIATEIGPKWKDLARALNIREGQIDNLSRNMDRVYQILNFHEEHCDSRVWRSCLMDALSQARRNDLRREAQHILDTTRS